MSWPGTQTPVVSIRNAADQLAQVLTAWATPRGGEVSIVANMQRLWMEVNNLAMSNSDQPRLIIVFTGEDARGGFEHANKLHRVDRQWSVAVIRGKGFSKLDGAPSGEAGADDTGRTDFYDDMETIRELIRCVKSISQEFPIDYKGMKSLPNPYPTGTASLYLDGFVINFSTANDIPNITLTP